MNCRYVWVNNRDCKSISIIQMFICKAKTLSIQIFAAHAQTNNIHKNTHTHIPSFWPKQANILMCKNLLSYRYTLAFNDRVEIERRLKCFTWKLFHASHVKYVVKVSEQMLYSGRRGMWEKKNWLECMYEWIDEKIEWYSNAMKLTECLLPSPSPSPLTHKRCRNE